MSAIKGTSLRPFHPARTGTAAVSRETSALAATADNTTHGQGTSYVSRESHARSVGWLVAANPRPHCAQDRSAPRPSANPHNPMPQTRPAATTARSTGAGGGQSHSAWQSVDVPHATGRTLQHARREANRAPATRVTRETSLQTAGRGGGPAAATLRMSLVHGGLRVQHGENGGGPNSPALRINTTAETGTAAPLRKARVSRGTSRTPAA